MSLPDNEWYQEVLIEGAQVEAEYRTTNRDDAVRQLSLRVARQNRERRILEARLERAVAGADGEDNA